MPAALHEVLSRNDAGEQVEEATALTPAVSKDFAYIC